MPCCALDERRHKPRAYRKSHGTALLICPTSTPLVDPSDPPLLTPIPSADPPLTVYVGTGDSACRRSSSGWWTRKRSRRTKWTRMCPSTNRCCAARASPSTRRTRTPTRWCAPQRFALARSRKPRSRRFRILHF
eukprot:9237818-Pyramimonas_sp.AAC.1